MPRFRRCHGQQILAQRFFVRLPVRPERSPGCPVRTEAFIVCHRILYDERFHPLWVGQGHTKANRPPVVLHVQRVVRQAKSHREVVRDQSDVVERIVELLRIWPVAVAVAWIIRRNQMISV